jgi:hypothetical protein
MEQGTLDVLAKGRVPMQRDHERQIPSADVEVPELPVDEVGQARPGAREEEVPRVCVAVRHGEGAGVGEP